MGRPPRERIVIDVSNSKVADPAQAARSGWWLKILGLLALGLLFVVVALFAGCYLWWTHYQTTPAYSLALTIDAAQRNDMDNFDRMVESDRVVENFVSQIIEKSPLRLGNIASALLPGQSATTSTTLPPGIKEAVRGRLVEELNQFSSEATGKPFIVIALSMPVLVKITEDQNTAHVTAKTTAQPVELTMQRDGDIWKITAVKDDAFVQQLVEQFVGSVTAGADTIDPVRKQKRKHK